MIPHRRFKLAHVCLALFLGWIASSAIQWCIDPQPVLEVPLSNGQTASIYMGRLVIANNPKEYSYYRTDNSDQFKLHTGNVFQTDDPAKPLIKEPQKQASEATNAKPVDKAADERGYLVPNRDLNGNVTNRFDYVDPRTYRRLPFYGYHVDDRFDLPEGMDSFLYRKTRYFLLRRSLPLDVILVGGFMAADFPAPLLLHQVARLQPLSSATLHTIITVPEKKFVSGFVLNGLWKHADINLSPQGGYVACFNEIPDQLRTRYQRDEQCRIWDVRNNCWLIPQPEADILLTAGRTSFMDDDILIHNSIPTKLSPETDSFAMLDVKSGKIIDQLNGITLDYFADKQVRRSADGELYYLRRVTSFGWNKTYELKCLSRDGLVKTMAQQKWDEAEVGVSLTSSLQSVVRHTGHNSLTRFIQDKCRNSTWYQNNAHWFTSEPRTTIYDWTTGRTYAGWRGNHRSNQTHDGESLLIIHDHSGPNNQVIQDLAQLYRLPLIIWSPWWSRCGFMVVSLLVFGLLWQRQCLNQTTPSASSPASSASIPADHTSSSSCTTSPG